MRGSSSVLSPPLAFRKQRMMLELVSRSAAKSRGLYHYFTGEPCGRGHIAQRVVHNYGCVECRRIIDRKNKKLRRLMHPDAVRAEDLNKYRRDLEKNRAMRRDNYYRNRGARISSAVSYTRERLKNDVIYKITHYLRTRLRLAIKRGMKGGSVVKDLGCSPEQFKEYMESKFSSGMTWDNWSFDGWHLDHIRPLASFDLSDRSQFLAAVHYTNLQPLWRSDNLKKGRACIPASGV